MNFREFLEKFAKEKGLKYEEAEELAWRVLKQ